MTAPEPRADGLLLVDKPEGPTSHDVVEAVRRVLGGARCGHAGTLDPFASGLLPLCIGEATKVAYASESGITVYGSKTTRFLYEVTNTVKDGQVAPGVWDTSQLPKGDYVLRIIAADYSGNEVTEGRDVLIRLGVNP